MTDEQMDEVVGRAMGIIVNFYKWLPGLPPERLEREQVTALAEAIVALSIRCCQLTAALDAARAIAPTLTHHEYTTTCGTEKRPGGDDG